MDPFGGMQPLNLAKMARQEIETVKRKGDTKAKASLYANDDDDDEDEEMDLAAERAKLRAKKAQQQAKNVIGGGGGGSPNKRSPGRSPRSPRAQDLYKPVGADDGGRVPLAWEQQAAAGGGGYGGNSRPPSGISRASSAGTNYSEYGL